MDTGVTEKVPPFAMKKAMQTPRLPIEMDPWGQEACMLVIAAVMFSLSSPSRRS